MQIEFIGCTSAGKSTLVRQILQTCRQQDLDVILGDDFVLQRLRLHGLSGYLPRGLLVNLIDLAPA